MKPVIGGVHHRGGISTPQIDAVGWRIGSDLSLMVISKQGCVCWDSCTAGLGHSVGALVSHRRGRTHGHGCWETGNNIYLPAGCISQGQTHRDGTQGCAVGM